MKTNLDCNPHILIPKNKIGKNNKTKFFLDFT